MKRLLLAAAVALGLASPAAAQIISSSAVLAANQVIKGAPGQLYGINVWADGTLAGAPWWIMIYDSPTAPADGTVTPRKCYSLATATTSFSFSFPIPIEFGTGITVGVSTTGCFTKTASTHAFISGDFQ